MPTPEQVRNLVREMLYISSELKKGVDCEFGTNSEKRRDRKFENNSEHYQKLLNRTRRFFPNNSHKARESDCPPPCLACSLERRESNIDSHTAAENFNSLANVAELFFLAKEKTFRENLKKYLNECPKENFSEKENLAQRDFLSQEYKLFDELCTVILAWKAVVIEKNYDVNHNPTLTFAVQNFEMIQLEEFKLIKLENKDLEKQRAASEDRIEESKNHPQKKEKLNNQIKDIENSIKALNSVCEGLSIQKGVVDILDKIIFDTSLETDDARMQLRLVTQWRPSCDHKNNTSHSVKTEISKKTDGPTVSPSTTRPTWIISTPDKKKEILENIIKIYNCFTAGSKNLDRCCLFSNAWKNAVESFDKQRGILYNDLSRYSLCSQQDAKTFQDRLIAVSSDITDDAINRLLNRLDAIVVKWNLLNLNLSDEDYKHFRRAIVFYDIFREKQFKLSMQINKKLMQEKYEMPPVPSDEIAKLEGRLIQAKAMQKELKINHADLLNNIGRLVGRSDIFFDTRFSSKEAIEKLRNLVQEERSFEDRKHIPFRPRMFSPSDRRLQISRVSSSDLRAPSNDLTKAQTPG